MISISKFALIGGLVLVTLSVSSKAQNTTSSTTTSSSIKTTLFEGIVAISYIDRGATINFTGPAIKMTHKPFLFLLGMLPSLKIKKDNSVNTSRNSTFIPTLGFGATAVYRHLAIQVPVLYNAKTAVKDGKWNVGIGLGYKF